MGKTSLQSSCEGFVGESLGVALDAMTSSPGAEGLFLSAVAERLFERSKLLLTFCVCWLVASRQFFIGMILHFSLVMLDGFRIGGNGNVDIVSCYRSSAFLQRFVMTGSNEPRSSLASSLERWLLAAIQGVECYAVLGSFVGTFCRSWAMLKLHGYFCLTDFLLSPCCS